MPRELNKELNLIRQEKGFVKRKMILVVIVIIADIMWHWISQIFQVAVIPVFPIKSFSPSNVRHLKVN